MVDLNASADTRVVYRGASETALIGGCEIPTWLMIADAPICRGSKVSVPIAARAYGSQPMISKYAHLVLIGLLVPN